MLPKGFLVGNLTADPISGTSPNTHNNYSRISVACNDVFIKGDGVARTHFFSCISWGKRAQFIQTFLKKGDKVLVEYTLCTNSYTTQEGKTIKSIDLLIDNIESFRVRSEDSRNRDRFSENSKGRDFSDFRNSGGTSRTAYDRQIPLSERKNEEIVPMEDMPTFDDIFDDEDSGSDGFL